MGRIQMIYEIKELTLFCLQSSTKLKKGNNKKKKNRRRFINLTYFFLIKRFRSFLLELKKLHIDLYIIYCVRLVYHGTKTNLKR